MLRYYFIFAVHLTRYTMHLEVGTELKRGEYRIHAMLGQGGFGITYLAEQVGLGRKVAIKEFFMKDLCNREAATSQVTVGSVGSRDLVERFRKKFLKEARNIASLDHKNIVPIIDVFEENGTAYYVMKYIAGTLPLGTAMREDDALRYIRQIASAIGYIHGKRMMHLDIKPNNILLDDENNAVLIDFGLAKQYDDVGLQTSTTPVGISHGYAPIEQYKNGGVDTFSPATDIYALGATLYRLLLGERPADALDLVASRFPQCPAAVSAPTWDAVRYAMQPLAVNRPQSIEEFLDALSKGAPVAVEEITELQPELAATVEMASAADDGVVEVSTETIDSNNEVPLKPKNRKSMWLALLLLVAAIAVVWFMYANNMTADGHHENVAKEQADALNGLDLEDGMGLIMEISEPDVVLAYVSDKENKEFKEAFDEARAATEVDGDFVSTFIAKYNSKGLGKVAAIFNASSKIDPSSTDSEVEAALRERIKEAIDNSLYVLRSRIDRSGIVHPNIQIIDGGRILVELPSVTDRDRVMNLLVGTANLQFWVACSSNEMSSLWIPAFEQIDREIAADLGDSAIMSRMQVLCHGGVLFIAESKDTAVINRAIDYGYRNGLISKDNVRFMWSINAIEKNSQTFQLYALKVTKADGSAALEGDVVAGAEVVSDYNGNPAVSIKMTQQAAVEWENITGKYAGEIIAIALDDYVYTAPYVTGKITCGVSEISGNFTIEEATYMANLLCSGKLSAPMKIVVQK